MNSLIKQINSYIHRMISEFITTIREMLWPKTPLHRNAYYLIASNAMTAICGFAFWVIVARFYTAEDVGLGSALISAVGLLVLFDNLGLGFGMIRFLPESKEKAIPIINSGLTLTFLASLVVSAIFIIGLNFWSPALSFIHNYPSYIIAFLLFSAFSAISGLLINVFIAHRSGKFAFFTSATTSAVKVFLPILLAGLTSALAIFASYGVATALGVGLALLFLLPKLQKGYRPLPAWNYQAIKEVMRYSLSNYLAYLFVTASNFIFPLMVVNVLGATSNAYFYIAWTIASILFGIPVSISMSLFTEGSHDMNLLMSNTRKSLFFAMAILSPLIIVIFFLGDKLLLLFGQAYSQEGATLLWVLALTTIPLTINNLYLTIYRVRKQMRRVILLSLTIAIVSLVSAYPLMLHLGVIGAGVAYLIGQSIVAVVVVLLWFCRRRSGTV